MALLAAIITTLSSSCGEELLLDSNNINGGPNGIHVLKHEDELPGRLRAQKPHGTITCDKYPRICVAKGSLGPDCCNKQCVNVMIDRVNCGMCVKKCKYQEICCEGLCVNPSFDGKNCGKCNNRCNSGSSCLYGMCSYA
ncbi:hypothetical protein Pfo_023211 [Paulownia fortunei]|nr:hypothetical protein Pfo_023211 [Paulownia fortunei]